MDAVAIVFLIAVLTCVWCIFWSLAFIARSLIDTFSTPKSEHDPDRRAA